MCCQGLQSSTDSLEHYGLADAQEPSHNVLKNRHYPKVAPQDVSRNGEKFPFCVTRKDNKINFTSTMAAAKQHLKNLTELRKDRPSYTRVISWELGQLIEPVTKKKNRKTSRKSSSANDEDSQDSQGDSHSDPEQLRSLSTSTVDSSGDEYFSTEETLVNDHDSSETSDEITNDEITNTSSFQSQGQTKSHASKKQRKRQRKSERRDLIQEVPFSSAEHIDFDYNPVWSVSQSLKADQSCNAGLVVPSLMELSLQACHTKVDNIPFGLRSMYSEFGSEMRLKTAHLAWLYDYLGICESYHNYVKYDTRDAADGWFIYKDPDPPTKKKNIKPGKPVERYPVHCRYSRHIWTADFNSQDLRYDGNYRTFHGANFLADSQMKVRDAHSCPHPTSSRLLSVFAELLHHLLPSHAHPDTAVEAVKRQLAKRYPTIVRLAFDEAVPYFWWGRGNIMAAEQAFADIIENHLHARHKALYLAECGRMLQQYEEPMHAVRCYLAAHEVLRLCGRYEFALSASVVHVQILILSAVALADTGIHTASKAERCTEAWGKVLECDQNVTSSVVCAAAASLLTFHATKLDKDGSTCLSKCESILSRWAAVHNDCLLFLAFVKLLQHYRVDAERDLRRYCRDREELYEDEGYTVADFVRGKRSWAPIDAYSSDGQNKKVSLMDVVWRTRLDHPVLEDHDRAVLTSDYRGTYEELYIGEDGYLTSDMQHTLPTMRHVKINPYTGEFIPQDQTGGYPTRNALAPEEEACMLPPYYTEVLSSPEYNVSLFISSGLRPRTPGVDNGVMYTACHACNLQRKNAANNHVNVLDLKKLVQLEKVKMVEVEIAERYAVRCEDARNVKKGADYNDYNTTPQWLTDMHQQLSKWARMSLKITFDELDSYVKHKRGYTKYKSLKSQGLKYQQLRNHLKKTPGLQMYPPRQPNQFELSIYSFKVFNQTVVMKMQKGVIFVNCSSEESFEQPIVHLEKALGYYRLPMSYNAMDFLMGPSEKGVTRFPYANIAALYSPKNPVPRLLIYNEDGHEIVNREIPRNEELATYHVIGPYLYGYTVTKDRLFYEDPGVLCRMTPRMPIIHRVLPMGERMMVHTEGGVAVFDKTLNIIPWKDESNSYVILHFDGDYLKCPARQRVSILKTKQDLLLVGRADHIMLLQVRSDEIAILCDVHVGGNLTEACFVGSEGFVVASSLHCASDPECHSTVFYFSIDGTLRSVLPFLGEGPFRLCPMYLKRNEDMAVKHRAFAHGQNFLAFCDGYGGIACAELSGIKV